MFDEASGDIFSGDADPGLFLTLLAWGAYMLLLGIAQGWFSGSAGQKEPRCDD